MPSSGPMPSLPLLAHLVRPPKHTAGGKYLSSPFLYGACQQVQLLPPRAASRAGRAAAMSLLCGTALLALLAVCCYALFGSDVQVGRSLVLCVWC